TQNQFEDQLSKISAKLNGPFLTADTYNAFYRSAFYSSFKTYGHFLMEEYGDADSAKKYADQLKGFKTQFGSDFYKWYLHLVAAEFGAQNQNELIVDLTKNTTLGKHCLGETFEQIAGRDYSYAIPDYYPLARAYFHYFDQ